VRCKLSDPATTAPVAAATAGLTLLGVATGLDAATLLAGLAGALLAQSYGSKAPWWNRAFVTSISAILAGYFAPAISLWFFADVELRNVFKLPIAALFGLIVHGVLGPAALKFAQKKAEEISK